MKVFFPTAKTDNCETAKCQYFGRKFGILQSSQSKTRRKLRELSFHDQIIDKYRYTLLSISMTLDIKLIRALKLYYNLLHSDVLLGITFAMVDIRLSRNKSVPLVNFVTVQSHRRQKVDPFVSMYA